MVRSESGGHHAGAGPVLSCRDGSCPAPFTPTVADMGPARKGGGHVPVPGGRKMLSHTDLWFGTQIQLTHIMTCIASTVFPKAAKWIVLGLSTPLAC